MTSLCWWPTCFWYHIFTVLEFSLILQIKHATVYLLNSNWMIRSFIFFAKGNVLNFILTRVSDIAKCSWVCFANNSIKPVTCSELVQLSDWFGYGPFKGYEKTQILSYIDPLICIIKSPTGCVDVTPTIFKKKKILVSSTQQQILSTCFIFSDRFRLIIQTSSGSLCKSRSNKGVNSKKHLQICAQDMTKILRMCNV